MIHAARTDADYTGVSGRHHGASRRQAAFLLAALIVASASGMSAQTRSAMLSVRLTVLRSCAVDTRPGIGQPGVTVTCSRGATPGIVSSITTTTVPTVAAVSERSTVEVSTGASPDDAAALPALEGLDEPAQVADASVTFELVTINF